MSSSPVTPQQIQWDKEIMGLTKEHLSPGGRLDEVGRWQAQHLQQVQCGCVTIAESQIQRLSRSRWDSGQTLSFTFKAQKI